VDFDFTTVYFGCHNHWMSALDGERSRMELESHPSGRYTLLLWGTDQESGAPDFQDGSFAGEAHPPQLLGADTAWVDIQGLYVNLHLGYLEPDDIHPRRFFYLFNLGEGLWYYSSLSIGAFPPHGDLVFHCYDGSDDFSGAERGEFTMDIPPAQIEPGGNGEVEITFTARPFTLNALYRVYRRNPETGEFLEVGQVQQEGWFSGQTFTLTDNHPLQPGITYLYYLSGVQSDLLVAWERLGTFSGEGISAPASIPETFTTNCYYNPFNPGTAIELTLENTAVVELQVFDLAGKAVRGLGAWDNNNSGESYPLLLRETLAPGRHRIRFRGEELPAGIYFYRLAVGDRVLTRKMLLVR